MSDVLALGRRGPGGSEEAARRQRGASEGPGERGQGGPARPGAAAGTPLEPGDQPTAIEIVAVKPSVTLPVITGVSSSAPSRNTLSEARLVAAKFLTLCS
jgi:hypothetical protein